MRTAGVPAFAASLCRKRLSCASIMERSTTGVGTPPEAPLRACRVASFSLRATQIMFSELVLLLTRARQLREH